MVPEPENTQFVIYWDKDYIPLIEKFETWADASRFVKKLGKDKTLLLGPVEIDEAFVWLFDYITRKV